MTDIKDIFENGINTARQSIINPVSVNFNRHVFGIHNLAMYYEPNFKITQNNKLILRNLLMYFSGNDASEYDLSKGLAIIGVPGTGKSLLLRIFKTYTSEVLQKNSFQVYTAHEVIDNVNTSGVEYLEKFGTSIEKPITCYIDDLAASKEKIQHYGTQINVEEKLLSMRYNVYERYRKLTHITTNKYPAEFLELYNDRIADRMNEMFNFIELKGESFRKPKS